MYIVYTKSGDDQFIILGQAKTIKNAQILKSAIEKEEQDLGKLSIKNDSN